MMEISSFDQQILIAISKWSNIASIYEKILLNYHSKLKPLHSKTLHFPSDVVDAVIF